MNNLTPYGKVTLGVLIASVVSFAALCVLWAASTVSWWTMLIPAGVLLYWIAQTMIFSWTWVAHVSRHNDD